MRTNIFLLLFFLFFIGYGCVSKKYIYIQNKTDHDIQVYKIDILDVGNDSDMKMVMQKNNLYSNLQNGKLTMRYQRVLKPDSLAFLDVVYGEKSKTELIDSNSNYFNGLLVILSKTDTIMFNQTEIIQKVNEAWFERNTDSSIKLKVHEKTRLTWKFRD
ncbi:hypothetical protein M2132_000394 [Dysgonomonas sp. PH5-45]|uniref:hypothetical protein n=1 Tax=unclassified Dysgonomonas TaxID=2630389 RepID=UPI0024748A13|nr:MULTISPECIES: hypothetical protein [unclassified Dysgonomonas]MDH6354072.1 hypothetical protein [Dysgonomonas sp. PH5-45]MDH6387077.1 hypothetical protein [Dysgonomonas sp. PH5-37]